jgi:TPR repeat protein
MGIAPDLHAVAKYFKIAADQGDSEAKGALVRILADLKN